MRIRHHTALVLAILTISGCSQSGDFGVFFIQKITEYGGRPKATGPLPALQARWTFEAEKNRFKVFVKGQPFSAVDAWLQQALGAPSMAVNSGPKAEPNRLW